MKSFAKILAIAALAAALCAPAASARRPEGPAHQPTARHGQNAGHNNHRTGQQPNPGKGHDKGHGNDRHSGHSTPPPVHAAPGHHNPHHNPHHSAHHSPHHNPHHSAHHYGPGWVMVPQPRPGRPAPRPWGRPVPPPHSWRYRCGGPTFGAVLGVALGSTIQTSINLLLNAGVVVDGYNSNMVYLRNVNQLGYGWADATMYYGGGGGLCGSEFYYATPHPDMMRYKGVYQRLTASYGLPTARSGNTCVWYGPGGLYIQLAYGPTVTDYGTNVYMTTLTYGL